MPLWIPKPGVGHGQVWGTGRCGARVGVGHRQVGTARCGAWAGVGHEWLQHESRRAPAAAGPLEVPQCARLWQAPSVATACAIGVDRRPQLSKVEPMSRLVSGALRPP